jgi:hypothetical protein
MSTAMILSSKQQKRLKRSEHSPQQKKINHLYRLLIFFFCTPEIMEQPIIDLKEQILQGMRSNQHIVIVASKVFHKQKLAYLLAEIRKHFPGEIPCSDAADNLKYASGTFRWIDPSVLQYIGQYTFTCLYVDKGLKNEDKEFLNQKMYKSVYIDFV